MPRKHGITRTGTVTILEVLVVNKEKKELENRSIALNGEYDTRKALEKAVKKEVDNDAYKFVDIVSQSTRKEKRGMTLTDWLKHSTIISADEDDTDEAEDETETDTEE